MGSERATQIERCFEAYGAAQSVGAARLLTGEKQQRAIRPLRSTPGCPVALKPESASGPGASAEPPNLKGAAR
jgi:hypothetical protein